MTARLAAASPADDHHRRAAAPVLGIASDEWQRQRPSGGYPTDTSVVVSQDDPITILLTPRAPRVLSLPDDVLVDLTWEPQAGGLSRRLITSRPGGGTPRTRSASPGDVAARFKYETGRVAVLHVRQGELRVVWASPGLNFDLVRRNQPQAVRATVGDTIPLRKSKQRS